MTTFATVIDFAALWKILVAALAVGVGLTSVFGAGALALERLADAQRRNDRAASATDAALVAASALLCVGAIALGLYAMLHK